MMLGIRTVHSATSLLRFFSSSAVAYRCPSIRDITVESTGEFTRRQNEFREKLKHACLKNEQQKSQSAHHFISSSTFFHDAFTALRVSSANIYGGIQPALEAAEMQI